MNCLGKEFSLAADEAGVQRSGESVSPRSLSSFEMQLLREQLTGKEDEILLKNQQIQKLEKIEGEFNSMKSQWNDLNSQMKDSQTAHSHKFSY